MSISNSSSTLESDETISSSFMSSSDSFTISFFASFRILSTASGIPCRSKKLIRDSRSAAEGLIWRIWSNEICQVMIIEFLASRSLRKCPASWFKRLVFFLSFLWKSSTYCRTEYLGSLCRMYAAAWTMASGMNSSVAANSTTSFSFICFPSLFSRSISASVSFIGSTNIMSFSSANRDATLLVRVVKRIEPCRLWSRFAKDDCWPVSSLLKSTEASSILSTIRTHFPLLSSRSHLSTSWNMSAFDSPRLWTLTCAAISP